MSHLLKGVLFENFEEICVQIKQYLKNKKIPLDNQETINKLRSFYTLPPSISAFTKVIDNIYDDFLN